MTQICPSCGQPRNPRDFRCGKGWSPRCHMCRFTESVQNRKAMTQLEKQYASRRIGRVPPEIVVRLNWLTPLYLTLEMPDVD